MITVKRQGDGIDREALIKMTSQDFSQALGDAQHQFKDGCMWASVKICRGLLIARPESMEAWALMGETLSVMIEKMKARGWERPGPFMAHNGWASEFSPQDFMDLQALCEANTRQLATGGSSQKHSAFELPRTCTCEQTLDSHKDSVFRELSDGGMGSQSHGVTAIGFTGRHSVSVNCSVCNATYTICDEDMYTKTVWPYGRPQSEV